MELDFDQYKLLSEEYIHGFGIEKGLVEGTIRQKEDLHRRLTAFLAGRAFNLETAKAFQQYLYANGCDEPSSRARYTTELRAFVNWLFKFKDAFERNWSFKIIMPKVPKKHLLFMDEVQALNMINVGCAIEPFHNSRIRKAKEETRFALILMLTCGFRPGEVRKMRGRDLILGAPDPFVILRKSKIGEDEEQNLHESVVPLLRDRVQNDFVVKLNKKTANGLLRKGAEKLGLTQYAHTCQSLRHVFVTSRLRKRPLQLVSKAVRHKNLKTTDQYYTHYNKADIAPVVNDSNIMQGTISAPEFLDKAKMALERAGLVRPTQYELKISESNGVVKIEAIFPEQKEKDDNKKHE